MTLAAAVNAGGYFKRSQALPCNVSEPAVFRARLEGWGAGEGCLFPMVKANGAKAKRERMESKGVK
ncbi:MAG: hypothetical protein LBQ12_10125 [Deltaproteobacteria bacterium]|nr:hypothetical protein [Deltaproteobacteria bacterium]